MTEVLRGEKLTKAIHGTRRTNCSLHLLSPKPMQGNAITDFCYISINFSKVEQSIFLSKGHLSRVESAVIQVRQDNGTLSALFYTFKHTFTTSHSLESLTCYHMHFFLTRKWYYWSRKGFSFFTKTQLRICQKIGSFLLFFWLHLCHYSPESLVHSWEDHNPVGGELMFLWTTCG